MNFNEKCIISFLLILLIMFVNFPIAKRQPENQVVTNKTNPLGPTPSLPSSMGRLEFEASNTNDLALTAEPSLSTSDYSQIEAAEALAGLADANETEGNYQLIWEPNRVQGSVHSVATYRIDVAGNALLAIGAGYLYDNEIHVYRWDNATQTADHVWDCGDGIIAGDVLSLTFGDTDKDSYIEIVAGSADRKIYVFEQRSMLATDVLYDQFQLVWNSTEEVNGRVTSVRIDDLDSDGLIEIIAGSWSRKVYVFEYRVRYGLPGDKGHRHWCTRVWDSGTTIEGLVNCIATGDMDYDTFKEIVVGASDKKVYIFENSENLNPEPVYPHIDNAYELVWNSSDLILGSIQSVVASLFIDDDPYGEIVVSSSGHGVYAFDYDPSINDYIMNRLLRPVEPWEGEYPKDAFPIDEWVDRKVSGNKTTGVFEPTVIPAPWSDKYLGNGATAMAGYREFNYTLFNATATGTGVATAVLDFGKDEELTGTGNNLTDLWFYGREVFGKSITLENLRLYISQNNVNFTRIEEGITISKYNGDLNLKIDVDSTLRKVKWEWFRYLKIETTTEVYVDCVEGSLHRPVADALVVSVGYVRGVSSDILDFKIIIGTVTGTIKIFDSSIKPNQPYEQQWDSYRTIPTDLPYKRRLSLETNIWSLYLLYSGPYTDTKTYMVAGTYPKVWFLQVNASSPNLEASVIWDTSPVLDRWTLSVEIDDTDGDGKKEVIVGSFDNNIYTFEHVYRNTYRRIWRSPDLKHNETFWDHVTDLVVGDTDKDGMMEIIAATDNYTYPQIYIFENIGEGRYSETQRINLPSGAGPISSISIGDDLDRDGVKEIVAAAKNKVYVYEDTTLVWNVTLPSAPYYYLVRSVVTGDTDKDGLGEIIFGGRYSGGITIFIYGGFLSIYENNGIDNQYKVIAWAPPYDHMSYCPINKIVLGDQDEDGRIEIIVGHGKGVNVYENTGNNVFETVHILTSSATYPPIQLNLVANTTPPNERIDHPPTIMQLKNGTFIIAYEKNIIDPASGLVNNSYIYTSISSNGATWSPETRISKDTDYEIYPTFNIVETEPSIIEYPNGTVWITYLVWPGLIYVVLNNGTGWTAPLCLNSRPPNPVDAAALTGPSICNYVYGMPTLGGRLLSVCWKGQNGSLFISYYTAELRYNPFTGRFEWYRYWESPRAVNSLIGAGFWASNPRMIALKDISYALVFEGYNTTSTKLDLDLFIMFSNDTINWSSPFNVTIASTNEYYPSIIQMDDETLIVTYQTIEGSAYYIYAITSTNKGISWGKTQVLKTGPSTTTAQRPTIARLNNGGFIYAYVSRELVADPLYVYSIYAGVNPVYGWWSTTIGPASCLDLGDTDNDGQREIIAGGGKNVYVFELDTTTQRYSQKWVSQQLAQLITDIATGDIDNDGVDEIVVTAALGNVYAFKWIEER